MTSTSSGDVGGRGRQEAAEVAAVVVQKSKESESGVLMVKKVKRERGSTAKDRISKMPPSTAGKRSSIYRGVTRF